MYSHTIISSAGPIIAASVSVACTILLCCCRWYESKPVKTLTIAPKAQKESKPDDHPFLKDPQPAQPITPGYLNTLNIPVQRIEARMYGESDRKVRQGSFRRRWSTGVWEKFNIES
ncbi:MAG: hypothetical protein JSR17_09385 [Proteobacteria bacterium]|nr:hypothetical protein [Pseudomonadota bacterium]